MTLLLQSFDVDSGTSYDGTWNLTGYVRGNYKLRYSWVDTGNVPWIWSGANNLTFAWVIKAETFPNFNTYDAATQYSMIANGANNNSYVISLSTANANSSGNTVKTALASDIETKIKNATNVDHTLFQNPFANPDIFHMAITVSYDSTSDTFTISVTNNDTEGNYFYFAAGWGESTSTGAGLFDASGYSVIALGNGESASIIDIKAQHIGQLAPKFLQMTFTGACAQLVTSCDSSFGAILLSLSDQPFDGQLLQFNNSFDALDIKLYRNNISISPVPFLANWILVFQDSRIS